MAFQSVPDTALFVAHFTGPNGVNASFGLYSKNTAAPWDATQLSVMAEALADAIDSDYMSDVSNEWTFTNVTARDLEVEFGRVHEGTSHNTVGSAASPSLPAAVAVRATFIGDPGAAPRRGGINLLPPTEAQVTGNLLSGGAITALTDAVLAMRAAMDAGAASHVIVSRYQGTIETVSSTGKVFREPVKRGVAVVNAVNDVLVKPRVDSQRRRRPAE